MELYANRVITKIKLDKQRANHVQPIHLVVLVDLVVITMRQLVLKVRMLVVQQLAFRALPVNITMQLDKLLAKIVKLENILILH